MAHLAVVNSILEASQVVSQLKESKRISTASHNMVAFRISSDGKSIDIEDRQDDGESGAGDVMLYTLQRLGVWNIVVVVSTCK